MNPFVLKTCYETIEKVKEHVYSYHQDVMKDFRVKQNNSNGFVLICPKPCQFSLRFNKRTDNCYYLTQFHDHTCSEIVNKFKRDHVSKLIRQHSIDYAKITPKDAMNLIRTEHGLTASYSQIRRVLIDAKTNDLHSFTKLESFLSYHQNVNVGTHYDCTKNDMSQMTSMFISFNVSSVAFQNGLPVIAVNAYPMRDKYNYVILLATGLDGNGQLYQLAFAMVPTELKIQHWKYFFSNLKVSLNLDENSSITVISDKDEVLINALKVELPNSHYSYCLLHMGRYLKRKFKFNLNSYIWKVAEAKTPREVDEGMNEIRLVNQDAYQFLTTVPKESWVSCYFPVCRYNQLTSNLGESTNEAEMEEIRFLHPFHALFNYTKIISKEFEQRANIYEEMALQYCPKFNEFYEAVLPTAKKLRVNKVSRLKVYNVDSSENSETLRITKLETLWCSCGYTADSGYLCVHLLAVILFEKGEPISFVNPAFHASTLKKMYSRNIYPCDIEYLERRDLFGIEVSRKRGRPPHKKFKMDPEEMTS